MCDCIDRMNSSLAEHNTRRTIPFIRDMRTHQPVKPNRVLLMVEKVDTTKRGALAWLPANYCPLCGEPYVTAESVNQT